MGRKKKKEIEEEIELQDPGIKNTIIGIVFFVLAIFFVLAGFDLGGVAGQVMFKGLSNLFGVGYAMVPIVLAMLSYLSFKSGAPGIQTKKWISALILFLSSLGIISIVTGGKSAGIVGNLVSTPFKNLFDVYIGTIFLAALFVISIVLLFDNKITPESIKGFFGKLFGRREKEEGEEEEIVEYYDEGDGEDEEEEEVEEYEPEPRPKKAPKEEDEMNLPSVFKTNKEYKFPPLSLLNKASGKVVTGDIKANSNIIKRTLENFGIEVEMDEVVVGPTVTRYSLKPAQGVRLSKITALQNELRLALAAQAIRIQAPIPGKSLVGVEIPNQNKATVDLRGLLSDDIFKKSHLPLLTGLGRTVSGKPMFTNISKMPHLLIAGATGSGKSVAVHTFITSLLYRNGPQTLRFIMVDPKRVELTLYNGIPHLLTPVITDPKKAILALKWAVSEMERRYNVLQESSARDINSYNEKCAKNKDLEKMPYIVVIIDELADIMTTYPRELEAGIVRLAQMSRAVGIHLILSTQRPSVNVITGLIKANIPARVALQVSSQIDSRTILDASGAEKLLGAGDMLYSSGEMANPERVQCAFISENEVKKVADYLKRQYQDELPDDINLGENGRSLGSEKTIFDAMVEDGEDRDELFDEAKEIVIRSKKASTSYLQRRLKIGYSRAARLIDELEDAGIVGEANGSKPREVLMKESDIDNSDDDNDYDDDFGNDSEEDYNEDESLEDEEDYDDEDEEENKSPYNY